MLPTTTIERLNTMLASLHIRLAYHIHPLPHGVLSAAQGGLAVLFPPTASISEQFDRARHLRSQLYGLMPPGHTEAILLNDTRLAVAAAVVERGTLIYSSDEVERVHYEMMILSRMLDFECAARRFLDGGAPRQRGNLHD